jgi:D-alanine-D-alanine ligase
MIKQINVMMLFGGESSEHEVSKLSARNVFDALDKNKFNVTLVFIDTSGKWWLLDSIDQVAENIKKPQITPVLGSGYFTTMQGHQRIKPDVILPILHGENGEDGSVQGLAQLLHIPIVGCKLAASAICMDKVFTKQLLEYGGIKTVPYVVHKIGEPKPDYKILSESLGKTIFIKPARCGSSVGVRKVKNSKEFDEALVEAYGFDSKVLIERAIVARELEVGLLGDIVNANASGVGEICPDSEFYSFESKYSEKSQTKVVIPADIPDELAEEIRATAIKAYKIIGCEGLSRIDFFLSDDNTLYLNEINTLPGFTNISMYPKLWRQKGISYSKLIESLIFSTLEK